MSVSYCSSLSISRWTSPWAFKETGCMMALFSLIANLYLKVKHTKVLEGKWGERLATGKSDRSFRNKM